MIMGPSSNQVLLRHFLGEGNYKNLVLKLVEFNKEIHLRNTTNFAEASTEVFETNITLLDRILERGKVLMHLIDFQYENIEHYKPKEFLQPDIKKEYLRTDKEKVIPFSN